MDQVSSYIEQLPANQGSIMLFLDQLLMDFPGVSSRLRYRIPFYDRKSWICYLNPIKNNGVELAFVRGNELSNQQGLLSFKDRKQVAGVEIFDSKSISYEEIMEVLNEAILLDDSVPYASKRTSKR